MLSNKLPRTLRYEDRNSMGASIETRVPFLDHELVEFCLNLKESLPRLDKKDFSVGKSCLGWGMISTAGAAIDSNDSENRERTLCLSNTKVERKWKKFRED